MISTEAHTSGATAAAEKPSLLFAGYEPSPTAVTTSLHERPDELSLPPALDAMASFALVDMSPKVRPLNTLHYHATHSSCLPDYLHAHPHPHLRLNPQPLSLSPPSHRPLTLTLHPHQLANRRRKLSKPELNPQPDKDARKCRGGVVPTIPRPTSLGPSAAEVWGQSLAEHVAPKAALSVEAAAFVPTPSSRSSTLEAATLDSAAPAFVPRKARSPRSSRSRSRRSPSSSSSSSSGSSS